MVRHLFVHPAHRRRGLAETMVRAVTRACLGASLSLSPSGAEASGDAAVRVDLPGCGVKRSVCLFYQDPGAARMYRRCGFVVDEDARDPATGESLCYVYELDEQHYGIACM
ncbi:uncharacterized protein B0H18DRAFT_1001778 [Fomitopsis serialis]|uniref:uncharacterized protein n=1 Tax=Fomitopsis serialis TaxID=139415 RepID=UPI0020071E69|nr:uncharacterized protein B0H18DRAFT_1001778 [Neoantrodia serialis]KAH9928192.1 hypothetical protein B0H18DRAFT_1001778 [Neoantrodia serialis]